MKTRLLSSEIRDSLRSYLPMVVGATNAMPGVFPSEFAALGINQRESSRNSFIGTTVTLPAANEGVFGLAYLDSDDGFDNEDLYVVDFDRQQLTYYRGAAYEVVRPEYRGVHWGDKSYLRP